MTTEGAAPAVGERLRLTVGAPAHGGHCIARHEGRAVFVRHALPGEEVIALVTEGGPTDRFWRADAVEILESSPDRVPSAWPEGTCVYPRVDIVCNGRFVGEARIFRDQPQDTLSQAFAIARGIAQQLNQDSAAAEFPAPRAKRSVADFLSMLGR